MNYSKNHFQTLYSTKCAAENLDKKVPEPELSEEQLKRIRRALYTGLATVGLGVGSVAGLSTGAGSAALRRLGLKGKKETDREGADTRGDIARSGIAGGLVGAVGLPLGYMGLAALADRMAKTAAFHPLLPLVQSKYGTIKIAKPKASDIVNMQGVGSVLGDIFGAFPSQRAGRGMAMAEAVGEGVPFRIRYPLTAAALETLGFGVGGAIAGAGLGSLTGNSDAKLLGGLLGSAAGTLGGFVRNVVKRRDNLRDVSDAFDEAEDLKEMPDLKDQRSILKSLLLPFRNPHQLHRQRTHRKIRGDKGTDPGVAMRASEISTVLPYIANISYPLHAGVTGVADWRERGRMGKTAAFHPLLPLVKTADASLGDTWSDLDTDTQNALRTGGLALGGSILGSILGGRGRRGRGALVGGAAGLLGGLGWNAHDAYTQNLLAEEKARRLRAAYNRLGLEPFQHSITYPEDNTGYTDRDRDYIQRFAPNFKTFGAIDTFATDNVPGSTFTNPVIGPR